MSQIDSTPGPDMNEMLAELGRNTPDEIKQMRSFARMTIRSKATVQPGNASQRNMHKFSGVTGDVSSGGCLMLLSVPVGVGDIYWLTFDREKIPLEPLLARCVRCRFIRESAFEVGFSFFDLATISAAAKSKGNEDLF